MGQIWDHDPKHKIWGGPPPGFYERVRHEFASRLSLENNPETRKVHPRPYQFVTDSDILVWFDNLCRMRRSGELTALLLGCRACAQRDISKSAMTTLPDGVRMTTNFLMERWRQLGGDTLSHTYGYAKATTDFSNNAAVHGFVGPSIQDIDYKIFEPEDYDFMHKSHMGGDLRNNGCPY